MRFLQTEWHRHERDRNAWEIERAEMKARIAQLEGTNRQSKELSKSLARYVKVLEAAVKRERDAAKAAKNGGNGGSQTGEKDSKARNDAVQKSHPGGKWH